MKLNYFIYKMENKIRRVAIEKLMQIISVAMLIVFAGDILLSLASNGGALSLNSMLCFDRAAIFRGQVWRIITFIFVYPSASSPLLVLLALYFYYWTGSAVEGYWGKARFNLYYLFGIIGTVIAGFIVGYVDNTISKLKVPYILTHMRGTPSTMHLHTQYDHLLSDVLSFFETRVRKLHTLGVSDIILDPGFGFAKTMEQNYALLSHLSHFKSLDFPLLVGVSHKSMLYKLLDIDVKETLNATTVANTIALLGGASILRVHEVRPAIEAIKIVKATTINQEI